MDDRVQSSSIVVAKRPSSVVTKSNQRVDIDKAIQASNNAPFFVFNLFADYIDLYGNGSAMTQDILYLLGLLGLTEQATRSTLLRMKRKGWLDAEREGRRTRYRLSASGRTITQQGDKRIFEPAAGDWNGMWQLVVYSLPEEKRALRNELRKKLVWFGFGRLASGAWISPHNRHKEVTEVLTQLEIGQYVSLFSAERIDAMSNAELVAKCWDLDALATQYAQFVGQWQPRLINFGNGKLDSAEARFRERFLLTFDFQPFPRTDPNLPVALLPPVWVGHQARQIFTNYRHHLNQGLPQFIATIQDR